MKASSRKRNPVARGSHVLPPWEIQVLFLLAQTRNDGQFYITDLRTEFFSHMSRSGKALFLTIVKPKRRTSKWITHTARVFRERADARNAEEERNRKERGIYDRFTQEMESLEG